MVDVRTVLLGGLGVLLTAGAGVIGSGVVANRVFGLTGELLPWNVTVADG